MAGQAGGRGARSRCAARSCSRSRRAKLDPLMVKDLEPLFEEMRLRRAKAASDLARSLSSSRYKELVARLSAPIAITTQGDAAFGSVAGELVRADAEIGAARGREDAQGPDRRRAPSSAQARESLALCARRRCSQSMRKQLGAMLKELKICRTWWASYHDAVVAVAWIKEFVGSRASFPPTSHSHAARWLRQFAASERKLKRRSLKEWSRLYPHQSRPHREKGARERFNQRGFIR